MSESVSYKDKKHCSQTTVIPYMGLCVISNSFFAHVNWLNEKITSLLGVTERDGTPHGMSDFGDYE